jgi:hypothetical protein
MAMAIDKISFPSISITHNSGSFSRRIKALYNISLFIIPNIKIM